MIQHNSTQKSKSNKNMMVQFSHLNQNNKTQFLQFLLKNNITFEKNNGKGKDDYVAKVTIAKPTKQNKQNQHIVHKNTKKKTAPNKSQSKSKPTLMKNQLTSISSNLDKSIKMLTPKKQNNVSVCEDKKINSIIQKKVSENKSIIDNQAQNSKKNQKIVKNNRSLKVVTNNKNTHLKTVSTTQFLTHDECQSAKKVYKDKPEKTIKNMIMKKQDSKLYKNDKALREQQFSKSRSLTKGSFQHHSNTKNIVEKSSVVVNKSQKFDKKAVPAEKQKIIEVNNQIKKKTCEQKQINQLVNRYLKLFDLKLLGQRPIKWAFSQLMKTIQQLYNQLFSKNTQNLVQKGYSQKQNSSQYSNNFIKFIRQFFTNKFKNEKLVNSNLINMLYSLSFYLQNEKKILSSRNYVKQVKANLVMTASGIFMQIFEDFLCQIYSFDDLLFYLFIRSIIINQANIFHATKMKIQKQSSKQSQNVLQKQIVLSYKDIIRVLKLILGQDMDLVEQYKLMILSHINSSAKSDKNQKEHMAEGQRQLKISGPEFMVLLVEDYRNKRLQMQDSLASFKQIKTLHNNKSLENYSLASQNTFQQLMHANDKKKYNIAGNKSEKAITFTNLNQNQHETDELTFGQETQENMEKFLSNQRSFNAYFSFWENYDESRQAEDLQADSLQSIIYQKMKKKVKQFFNILIQNRSQYNSLDPKNRNTWNQNNFQQQRLNQPGNMQTIFIIELLMKKSISLLNCIVDMNKIKWFQELKVDDPTQQDIDKVEQLQLTYRKLKSDPDAQGIGKLCKNILTVPQLTFALQKLLGV